MAHFAEINDENIVTRVLVVNNNELLDDEGNEVEQKGIDFLNTLFGHTNWVQTSYNGNIRYNFAGIGFTYDEDNDAFYSPQPFDSWSLNSDFIWEAPIPYPDGDNLYVWDEDSQTWIENN